MTESRHKTSRTYDWVSTEAIGAPLVGRTGLQYFQALRDGAIPPQPIAATIGWSVVEVEEGRLRVEVPVGAHLFHGGGMVHGGVLATLLDCVTAGAVMTTLPEGALCATTNLNVQYLTAVRPSCEALSATGRLVHRGGKICSAEAFVEDGRGAVYARATATLFVSERPAL